VGLGAVIYVTVPGVYIAVGILDLGYPVIEVRSF
jgi:hypothetical protein